MSKKKSENIADSETSVVGQLAPEPIKFTKRITPVGMGRDEDGAPWAVVQVTADGGSPHPVLVSLAQPPIVQAQRLNKHGAHIVSERARAEMTARFQEFETTDAAFRVATKVGVHGTSFVFPDRIYSSPADRQPTLLNAMSEGDSLNARFKTAGSASGYVAGVASTIATNSRMAFALGLMLVGPLALFGEFEQVAGQLVGDPGDGKTAIGAIVSMVWGVAGEHGHGRQYGFGETWNQTDNALERYLASVNNTGAFLDETGSLDQRAQLLDIIMRIASGKTKGRMTEADGARWFVGLLSTSNASVAELAKRANRKADRAHFDRLIDVPAPRVGFGMFENLCDHADLPELVGTMKDRAMSNCGMLGRAYVTALVTERVTNFDSRRRWIDERIDVYARLARKFSPDTDRLNRKFGTIYAALALACDLDVLPFKRELFRKAIVCCHRDHLRFIAEEQRRVGSNPFDTIRAYVARRRPDMVSRARASLPVAAHPGIRVKQDGELRFLFASTVFDRACGGHHASLEVKARLDKMGAIKSVGQGKNKRFAVKETIAGKRVAMINVRASAFA